MKTSFSFVIAMLAITLHSFRKITFGKRLTKPKFHLIKAMMIYSKILLSLPCTNTGSQLNIPFNQLAKGVW